MNRIRIDVKTRTLPHNPKVYLVRPGARYHHYSSILKHSALPTDAPFLEVMDGKGVPSALALAPALARARALRKWGSSSRNKRGPRPSIDIDFYRTFLADQGEKMLRTKLRNAAQEILWTIPTKSLLMIPAPTLSGMAILAEAGLRTAPRIKIQGTGQYRLLEYTARPIKDIRLVPMRDLPSEVTDQARKQISSQEITKYAQDRLLRAYYGDYQRGSDHMVAGFMAAADDFDARAVAQFIGLTLSVEHFLQTRDFIPPAEMIFGGNYDKGPSFHARVNSPDGTVHIETQNRAPHIFKALALVAASAFPISASSQALTNGQVVVENSAKQSGEKIIDATQDALVDYARAAGASNMEAILNNLKRSIELTEGKINGTAIAE